MASIDNDMNTTFMNDKHRFTANVVYSGNWIMNRFANHIGPFGISPQQFNILRILKGAKSWLSMNDVKQRMVEKSPNATRLCDKLLVKELLSRRRNESDRRVVDLKISEKGLVLLREIDEKDDGSYTTFWDNITDEEAKLVSDILDKMRA